MTRGSTDPAAGDADPATSDPAGSAASGTARPRPRPAAAPTTPGRPAPRGRLRDPAVLIAVAAALVLLAGTVVFAVLYVRANDAKDDSLRDRQAESTQVQVAAEKLAVDISTYDYRTLDKNFAAVESQLSSGFAAEYKKTSAALRATIVQYKAVATAKVLDTGLVRLAGSKAVVILFLDQTVTNSRSSTPTVGRNRILVNLTRSGSRWTVTALSLE